MDEHNYIFCKLGRVKAEFKKSKFGSIARTGATLRRNKHTNSSSLREGRKHNYVIAKHVSETDEWKAKIIEERLKINDGELLPYQVTVVPNNRGKGTLTPIAQNNQKSTIYSMNKKKRWLLPEMLKQEIKNRRCTENEDRDVDIIVIEREISHNSNVYFEPTNFADTVGVFSTMQSRDEDDMMERKPKRRKYSWSTDLLGLSQKRNDNEVEINRTLIKPQVIYEVCWPRPLGSYPDYAQQGFNYYKTYERSTKWRAKRKFQYTCREYTDVYPVDDVLSHESNNASEMQSCNETKSYSIDSWIRATKLSTSFKTSKKQRKFQSVSSKKNPSSMKDHVIYETRCQKMMGNENNQQHSSAFPSADSYLEKTIKREQENSWEMNVFLASLQDLDCCFPTMSSENKTAQCNFHGFVAIRSCSRPAKYAFQMQDLASAKSSSSSVIAYLTLDVISDIRSCRDYINCYERTNFCHCNEYLSMKIKTTILSEEKSHQQAQKLWNKNLKEFLGSSGKTYLLANLKDIIQTASAALKLQDNSEIKETNFYKNQHVISPLMFYSYRRKVVDKALSLIGLPVSQQCYSDFAQTLQVVTNDLNEYETKKDEKIAENRLTINSCDICWVELCKEEGQIFFAMPCKHWYCTDCWRSHVISAALNAFTPSITCPGYNCDIKLDIVTLMTLLPGDVMSRYQSRQLHYTVKRSNMFYKCFNCAHVIKIQSPLKISSSLILACVCGARWCSRCEGSPHWPASCDVAKLYFKKAMNIGNGGKDNLITSVSGRKCPRCKEPIDKNGGCQMMNCVCGYVFCWKCMKSSNECRYRCRLANFDLDTWELTPVNSKFQNALNLAETYSRTYLSQKQHVFRNKLSERVAFRLSTLGTHQGIVLSFSARILADVEAVKELKEMLLFCDALRFVMQFLVLSSVPSPQVNKDYRTKMNNILICLQQYVYNIERCISMSDAKKFDNIKKIRNYFNKQAIPAQKMIRSLKSFLDKFEPNE